jgi:hypothetical protein
LQRQLQLETPDAAHRTTTDVGRALHIIEPTPSATQS